jgi:murein DD-endopeptidase MepM/ murein hydrolase activator NlpD
MSGSDPLLSMAPLARAQAEAPRAPAADDAEAARQFEAYLVGFMATQMRSTVKGGPFAEGAAAMFADLFDQEIGKRVADSGGFGLKDSIARGLSGVGQAGGATGAGGVGGTAAPARIRGVLPGSQPARAVAAAPPAHEHDAAHAVKALTQGVIGRLTSGFGVRANPMGAGTESHPGMDLGAASGTAIKAVRDGTVRFSGPRGGYGNIVILDHGDGTETRYAHCSRLDVAEGATVKAGEVIAAVGSTGRSTGPHLHFEVRVKGAPVDPSSWITAWRNPLDP